MCAYFNEREHKKHRVDVLEEIQTLLPSEPLDVKAIADLLPKEDCYEYEILGAPGVREQILKWNNLNVHCFFATLTVTTATSKRIPSVIESTE